MSLLVITGPPGAGKTSVAAVLARSVEPSVLVAGDDFFACLRRGAIPPWHPGSDDQNRIVTQAAASAAGAFAAGDYATIYEGIVGPWFVETFAQATGLTSLDYVVLLPTEECCVERVASRSNHGFTDEEATRHMHRQFVTRSAALDPAHVLVDPPGTAEATAELISHELPTGRFTHHIPFG
jgi:dephospho-CoA kinase